MSQEETITSSDQMEQLLAAGRGGNNIEALRVIIELGVDDLRNMADKWGGYTPLHVACFAGYLNLVQLLLTRMPDFAAKQDKYGVSPLHIAAGRGHIDIVEQLLGVRLDLSDVEGPGNRIPLHYAIENGKLTVVRRLISASPDSLQRKTTQEETVLHLALKNNQLDAFKLLWARLKESKKEAVINCKDNKGNTALHLAVADQNRKVVEFMLREHALGCIVLELNACNKNGWTPLDCLHGWGTVDFLRREAGDEEREIRKLLVQAGAIHGRRRDSSLALEAESKADIRNALLVVAGLIVNATYQSVLQAPHFKAEVDKTHTEGFLAWYVSWMTGLFGREFAYIFFISGNTFGFLVSVQMIICLAKDLPFKLAMLLSMAVMVQTYYGHTYYLPFTSLEKKFGLKNVELFSVLPLTIPILLLLLQRPLARALESYWKELSLFDHLSDMYHI